MIKAVHMKDSEFGKFVVQQGGGDGRHGEGWVG